MLKYGKCVRKSLQCQRKIKKGTINRILEMSDEEVAIAVLTGKLKMP
jgi:PHP family Zn ribbon phosphoesterase